MEAPGGCSRHVSTVILIIMGLVYWLPAFLRTDFLYGMSAVSFFRSLWREVEKEMNKLKNDLENGMFLAAGMVFFLALVVAFFG